MHAGFRIGEARRGMLGPMPAPVSPSFSGLFTEPVLSLPASLGF
jgi:hypothetical protein